MNSATIVLHTHPQSGDSVYIASDGRAFWTPDQLAGLMGIKPGYLIEADWFKDEFNYAEEFPTAGVACLTLAEDAQGVIEKYLKGTATNRGQSEFVVKEMKQGPKLFAYAIARLHRFGGLGSVNQTGYGLAAESHIDPIADNQYLQSLRILIDARDRGYYDIANQLEERLGLSRSCPPDQEF